jgi:transcriptional regulator with XRE-family HTH domain
VLTPAQIRAARALLNVKQSELAKAAGISLATLNNIERGVGDPRASTLDAIGRALEQAGVETESDPATDTVRLRRLSRPSAYETYQASQRILTFLSRDSLLKPEAVLFYARRDQAVREGPESLKLCTLLQGTARTVLFDQVSFTFSGGARAAETAGVLLAAFALHPGRLFYLDRPTEDTTLSALTDAIVRLTEAPHRRLDHPKPLIDLFGDWDGAVLRYGERDGHPLHDLVRLVGESPKPLLTEG